MLRLQRHQRSWNEMTIDIYKWHFTKRCKRSGHLDKKSQGTAPRWFSTVVEVVLEED
jgi:hypothetical protein